MTVHIQLGSFEISSVLRQFGLSVRLQLALLTMICRGYVVLSYVSAFHEDSVL